MMRPIILDLPREATACYVRTEPDCAVTVLLPPAERTMVVHAPKMSATRVRLAVPALALTQRVEPHGPGTLALRAALDLDAGAVGAASRVATWLGPNVYADARVCWGGDGAEPRSPRAAWARYWAAPGNADLWQPYRDHADGACPDRRHECDNRNERGRCDVAHECDAEHRHECRVANRRERGYDDEPCPVEHNYPRARCGATDAERALAFKRGRLHLDPEAMRDVASADLRAAYADRVGVDIESLTSCPCRCCRHECECSPDCPCCAETCDCLACACEAGDCECNSGCDCCDGNCDCCAAIKCGCELGPRFLAYLAAIPLVGAARADVALLGAAHVRIPLPADAVAAWFDGDAWRAVPATRRPDGTYALADGRALTADGAPVGAPASNVVNAVRVPDEEGF